MKNAYLKQFFLTLGLLLAAHAALCWYTDPFAIYRNIRVEPVRPYALDLFYVLRLTKAHLLEKIRPDIVILGSSRSAMLQPTHLKTADEVAYNAALPGLTAEEMWGYFQHIAAIKKPARLVVMLDYESFVTDAPATRNGYEASRLAERPADLGFAGSLRRHYPDYANTLLSSSASRGAVKTLLHRETSGNTYFSDGTWQLNDRAAATMTARGNYASISRQYFRLLTEQRPQYDLAYLRSIVAECYRQGIAAEFVITPVHGMMATVYGYTHHAQARARWQREVAQAIADGAGSGRDPFRLWGFEDNDIATMPLGEELPQDRPAFVDGLHMNALLGDAVLQDIKAGPSQQHYGTLLTPATIDEYLRATAQRLASFQRDNPGDIAWLEKTLSLNAATPADAAQASDR